jgi:hypothetical protein
VRVVVSRFPSRTEDGRGAGVVIDGWQYELYGTDLDVGAWPEAEVVAGYYGRTGQENRFFQEDRELGLDRIFSYHLPGQQLATLVGLFVWNFCACRGMDLAAPPGPLPAQPPTQVAPVNEPPRLPEPGVAVRVPPENSVDGDDVNGVAVDEVGPSNATSMDAVDWRSILKNHQHWTWSAPQGGLQCPDRVVLPLVRIEHVKGTHIPRDADPSKAAFALHFSR